MKFKAESAAWKADDDFGMYFSFKDYPHDPPKELYCTLIGHSSLVTSQKKQIDAADLHLLRVVKCGTRESSGQSSHRAEWSSNIEFGVYEHRYNLIPDQLNPYRELVFAMKKGGGDEFYLVDQLAALGSFHTLLAHRNYTGDTDPLLWDVIYMIVGSYNKGFDEGTKKERLRLRTAFLEDRLKKRKMRHGPPKVWVIENGFDCKI